MSTIYNHSDMYEYYMKLDEEDLLDLCRRRLILTTGNKKDIVARLMRQDRHEIIGYSRL